MKALSKNLIIFLISTNSLLASMSLKGGDQTKIRTLYIKEEFSRRYEDIKKLLEKNLLKDRLILILQELENISFDESEEVKLLKELMEKGLAKKIKESTYYIVDSEKGEKCPAEKKTEHFSTSYLDGHELRICFDLSKIDKGGDLISFNELLGLAYHQHIQQFGIEDRNHKHAYYLSKKHQYRWNIAKGNSCYSNLLNGGDGDTYIRYIGLHDTNLKESIRTEITSILKLANCKGSELEITKFNCLPIRNSHFLNNFICEVHTSRGYFTVTQDLVDHLHISFMRYD